MDLLSAGFGGGLGNPVLALIRTGAAAAGSAQRIRLGGGISTDLGVGKIVVKSK